MTIQTSDKFFVFFYNVCFIPVNRSRISVPIWWIYNELFEIKRLVVNCFYVCVCSVRERMNRFTRWVIFRSFAYQLSTINKLTWYFRFDIGPVYLLEQIIFSSGSELSHQRYLPIPPDEAAFCSLTLSRCRDPKIFSNFLSAWTENQTRGKIIWLKFLFCLFILFFKGSWRPEHCHKFVFQIFYNFFFLLIFYILSSWRSVLSHFILLYSMFLHFLFSFRKMWRDLKLHSYGDPKSSVFK